MEQLSVASATQAFSDERQIQTLIQTLGISPEDAKLIYLMGYSRGALDAFNLSVAQAKKAFQ